MNKAIKNIEIHYNDLGLIDWRKMIPDKFIVINEQKYPDLSTLSPEDKEKIPEDAKLIKLTGFRYLARVRGTKRIEMQVVENTTTEVIVSCEIDWIASEENPEGATSRFNASVEKAKLDDTYQQHAVVIAGNRAFSKCVREFLEIDVTGQEEVSTSPSGKSASDSKPSAVKSTQAILTDKMGSRSFEDILKIMDSLGIERKETYKSIEDLPPAVCVSVIGCLTK